MNEAVGRSRMSDDPTMQRLDDQIEWYDKRSNSNQRTFKVLKVIVIAAAALIPLLAGLPVPAWVMGALGVVIALTEGIQQLNQYQANWISYRSTCETLKHEKFLYLGKAGPYKNESEAHSVLAERIESLVSQEHAKWASDQENAAKTKEGPVPNRS
jgi:hypothetical protein